MFHSSLTILRVKEVDGLISGPIRDISLKHGAHKNHCLYLQHQHHRIGAGEAVVKVNGTTHVGYGYDKPCQQHSNQFYSTTQYAFKNWTWAAKVSVRARYMR
jgi:hypothetical protein